MVETQADEADEATEDEAMNAEPSYAFAKGYGRFGIGYTTGWNLISTRFSLTKVPGSVLSEYYRKGYPFTPKMADRPYNQYGTIHHSEDRWDQLCGGSLGTPRSDSNSRAISRHLETTWATVRKPPIQVTKPATGGGSSVVIIRSLPTQKLPPCRSTSAMRWVTLVTFSIVA